MRERSHNKALDLTYAVALDDEGSGLAFVGIGGDRGQAFDLHLRPPERQNELTRRIQDKLSAAAKKAEVNTTVSPLPTPSPSLTPPTVATAAVPFRPSSYSRFSFGPAFVHVHFRDKKFARVYIGSSASR